MTLLIILEIKKVMFSLKFINVDFSEYITQHNLNCDMVTMQKIGLHKAKMASIRPSKAKVIGSNPISGTISLYKLFLYY